MKTLGCSLAVLVGLAAPAMAQGCPPGMEQGCPPPLMEQQLQRSFNPPSSPVPLNYNRIEPQTPSPTYQTTPPSTYDAEGGLLGAGQGEFARGADHAGADLGGR